MPTPMLKSDVVRHYGGSQAAVGRELGIGRAAVSKWPPVVPRGWAAELHLRTDGTLHFDPAAYQDAESPAVAA